MALTSHHKLPPFPSDIRTAPLVSISLAKLEDGDVATSEALFQACKDLGFFYLDMLGSKLGEKIVAQAEQLNAVQEKFWAMSNEDKDQYGRDKVHDFFAYRYSETAEKGENGASLRNENYNVSSVINLTDSRFAKTAFLVSPLASRGRLLSRPTKPCLPIISLIAAR